MQNLKNTDIPQHFVQKAFFNRKTKIQPEVITKLDEQNNRSLVMKRTFTEKFYKKLLNNGTRFYSKNKEILQFIQRIYKVDLFILLGVIGIETNFGLNCGSYNVFNTFYTLITKSPQKRLWAARQLSEFLKYTYVRSINPHAIKGSYAGAFGYGQFLPSSFNAYATTVSKKGFPMHNPWPDTLASIANYLINHGYAKKQEALRMSLYSYNRNNVYVDAVIKLATLLKNQITDL